MLLVEILETLVHWWYNQVTSLPAFEDKNEAEAHKVLRTLNSSYNVRKSNMRKGKL